MSTIPGEQIDWVDLLGSGSDIARYYNIRPHLAELLEVTYDLGGAFLMRLNLSHLPEQPPNGWSDCNRAQVLIEFEQNCHVLIERFGVAGQIDRADFERRAGLVRYTLRGADLAISGTCRGIRLLSLIGYSAERQS